jgi:23S rRNA-/tRNA-specific pseudouridylate synthase
VHLSSIGHPIAGDRVYATGVARRGPTGLDRLFLHSWRIELAAVEGDRLIRAEAPLPASLAAVLDNLRPHGAAA